MGSPFEFGLVTDGADVERLVAGQHHDPHHLWVPRTSSTSCDQPVFVDHATYASAPSETVLLKIDRFG